MHRIAIFLVVSAWANIGFAQPVSTPKPAAQAAAATDTGLTSDGKIMLGLEGRGNYRKPKVSLKDKAEKAGDAVALDNPASTFNNAMKAKPLSSANNEQPTVAADGVKPRPAALRSDKALFKVKDPTPAATTANTTVQPATTATAPIATSTSKVIPNTLPALPTTPKP